MTGDGTADPKRRARRAAVAGLVAPLLLAACSDAAPAGTATPAQLFDHAPAFPGYPWTYNGQTVGWQVAATSAGPEHCGWQGVTFLTLGWPPGTYSATSAHSRQYVRDPRHLLLVPAYLRSRLDLSAHLPGDARPTGLRYRGVEIDVAADADTAIYMVGGGHAERWPRSDPMSLCE